MDWTYLGHATWLATLGEIRVIFDPLIDPRHHGDVFELRPRRRIDAEALRPDFVVVSHRHPDHFDVPSLHRLATLDPDTVVITSDALVARAAKAVGFSTVARVDAMHRIELEGAALLTTPSFGLEQEWGVMVRCDEAVVYNQVDTVMRSEADARQVIEGAARGLDWPQLRQGLDLALVRWQPLREVAAVIGEAGGFPLAEYRDLIEQIAALAPKAAIPASAGSAHAPPHGAMNRVVYPLDEARFRRDLAARCPTISVLAGEVGSVTRVVGGQVTRLADRAGFVEVEDAPAASQRFEPFALPPLVDPGLCGRAGPELRDRARAWLEEVLSPALVAAWPAMGAPRPLRFALDLVGSDLTERHVLVVDGSGARRGTGDEGEDYDVLNAVAASALVEVIEGRRHWGEPLLAGLLRSSSRAYLVDEAGLRSLNVAPIFLYYALSYAESHERWVDDQLRRLGVEG